MKFALNQTVVYWVNGGSDGRGGLSFGSASEISCRFEEKTERYIDQTGEEKLSKAVLYYDSSMSVGDRVYNGSIDDLDSSGDPHGVVSWPIMAVQKIPNVKGSQFLYKAML